MSGGSYDYLYARQIEDFVRNTENIRRMMARLDALGYKDASIETGKFIAELEKLVASLEARQAELADIWQAVEWRDSGDWGPEDIAKAVEEWREKKRLQETQPC